MKSADNEYTLFAESKVVISHQVDQKILDDALGVLRGRVRQAGPSRWRQIMQNTITKTAIAAGILLLVLWLLPFNRNLPRAYAIEQTLEALETIETVYFKAEFYKQGQVECWMKFEEGHNKPTHVCLFRTGFPVRVINSPNGLFAYNETTNRYKRNTRDEREADWYLDFANFFSSALKAAQTDPAVTIRHETDPASQKPVITIGVQEEDRQCSYTIDPRTKLPIRFTSTEPKDIRPWMRKTIAVKNMEEIVYNQIFSEALFSIPDNAKEVIEEIDVHVTSENGIPVGSMSREEACEQLVRQAVEAMGRCDFQTAQKLYFPLAVPPKDILEQIRQRAGDAPLIEILEIGQPHEEGAYWIVPCKVRELGKTIKEDPVRVRFYELDGTQYCIIAMPD
jgi:hypothetical protein